MSVHCGKCEVRAECEALPRGIAECQDNAGRFEEVPDMTTIYVFDHRSGFEWRWKLSDAFKELDEYTDAGWITPDDGLYAVPVPFDREGFPANREAVTDHLSCEDWLALGGSVLWRPSPSEVGLES